MNINTHQKINQTLCGVPLAVEEGYSRVELRTTENMAADDFNLVHGGFIFGLADYAAMLAVNHPNVVLGTAEVRFLKPVCVAEVVVAEARVIDSEGKKRRITVTVTRGAEPVFEGQLTGFVPERHVLTNPAPSPQSANRPPP